MLKAQTAIAPVFLTRSSQGTKDCQMTEVNERGLPSLSGESPETLQFFTELHRSKQFTEATALQHFAGVSRGK